MELTDEKKDFRGFSATQVPHTGGWNSFSIHLLSFSPFGISKLGQAILIPEQQILGEVTAAHPEQGVPLGADGTRVCPLQGRHVMPSLWRSENSIPLEVRRLHNTHPEGVRSCPL